jgi:hypothetical protein
MAFSGMLRRVALVRTDVSEEINASFIGATRICELGTTLAVNIMFAVHLDIVLNSVLVEGNVAAGR